MAILTKFLIGLIGISGLGIISHAATTSPITQSVVVPTSISIQTSVVPTTTPVLTIAPTITPRIIPRATATPFIPTQAPLSNNNTYTNVSGNEVHSPAYSDTVPVGASAQCRDGTYSYSENRRGTCSHHGGVAEWL